MLYELGAKVIKIARICGRKELDEEKMGAQLVDQLTSIKEENKSKFPLQSRRTMFCLKWSFGEKIIIQVRK